MFLRDNVFRWKIPNVHRVWRRHMRGSCGASEFFAGFLCLFVFNVHGQKSTELSGCLITHVFHDDVCQAAICHVGPLCRALLLSREILPYQLFVQQGISLSHWFFAEMLVAFTGKLSECNNSGLKEANQIEYSHNVSSYLTLKVMSCQMG